MLVERYASWARLAMFSMALVIVSPVSSFAACTTDAAAAKRAGSFLANPASLLTGPDGPKSSESVQADVRDFVAADPRALASVITLLNGMKSDKNSGDMQKAIGNGLGQAATTCLRPDPTFAGEIQTQLAGTESELAKNEYAAITGNRPIGSVANGGAGGGTGSSGSVGGQTNPVNSPGSSSSFQAFSANSVSNSPSNYFGGGASGISAVGSGGTNTTTIVCAVSTSCQ